MAQVTKTVLKTYFNTGDLPTESNFIDLIDSSQSTLVAGDNISLTSQNNGSVKIDANVSNNGIITTFNNNNEPFCRNYVAYNLQRHWHTAYRKDKS